MVLVPVLAQAGVELVEHHAGGEPGGPGGARRSGSGTGLVAMREGEAVGWVGLGPREDFPRHGAVANDAPASWRGGLVVNCFVVAGRSGGKGVVTR